MGQEKAPLGGLALLADAYREKRTGQLVFAAAGTPLRVRIEAGHIVALGPAQRESTLATPMPRPNDSVRLKLERVLAEIGMRRPAAGVEPPAAAPAASPLTPITLREEMIERLADPDQEVCFEEGGETPTDLVAVVVATEPLILEAVRQTQPDDLVLAALGDLSRPLVATRALADERTLTLTEGYLLSHIDGELPARQVLQRIPLDTQETRRALLGLVLTGRVAWRPAANAAAAGASASSRAEPAAAREPAATAAGTQAETRAMPAAEPTPAPAAELPGETTAMPAITPPAPSEQPGETTAMPAVTLPAPATEAPAETTAMPAVVPAPPPEAATPADDLAEPLAVTWPEGDVDAGAPPAGEEPVEVVDARDEPLVEAMPDVEPVPDIEAVPDVEPVAEDDMAPETGGPVPEPRAAARQPPDPATMARRREVLEFFQSLPLKNHFEVLGVEPGCNDRDVRQAYVSLVKRFHPDSGRDRRLEDLHDILEAITIRVGEAWEVLGEARSRASYESRAGIVRRSSTRTDTGARPAGGTASAPAAPPPPVPPLYAGPDEETVSPEQILFRARRFLAQARYWDAIQILESALPGMEPPSQHHRGRLLLARAYSKNPNWLRRAEEMLQELLREDPTSADVHYELGLLYKTGGFVARAQSMFRRALELRPGHKEALAELEAPTAESGSGGGGLFRRLFKRGKAS